MLRAGSYHERVFIPQGKELTIQSYPGEAVWFDGSSTVTGWTAAGSAWVAPGWNFDFDSRVSFTAGSDESSRWLDPAYPMAGHPEQVWVDGVKLTEVGSLGEVTKGKFFTDTAGNRLVIGTNPSGHDVRASTLEKAIQIQGAGSTVRGLGVRNYADHLATLGTVSAEMPNITLENLVVQDNATMGVEVWAKGATFRNLTVSGNGMLGLNASKSDDLHITDSVFSGNNSEHFKDAPASGGAKLHNSTGVLIENSLFDSNVSGGLWFDVSMRNATVVNTTVSNNGSTGMEVELSQGILLAGNYFVGNERAGLEIYDAGGVQAWNNVVADNELYSVRMLQDARVNSDAAVPWQLRGVTLRNNIIDTTPTAVVPILVQDLTATRYANDWDISLDGNLYHRSSASAPSNFAYWANGKTGLTSFKTLATFTNATGNDTHSKLVDGAEVLTADYALTGAGSDATKGVARALPPAVANALGVATSWAKVGPAEPFEP
ncbi:right-handed parallel beta-helix repeat-containing protein [Cellulomonas rhizosphaerae]|uniref:Right-handed parallel beta-helix repeat-containing protein n=1 Tax=Cellulomonas rhizosphaerae TaxID=2293719 RepID=A0A413RM79_9CELL|nr:right-handed parallel beta-helix repeat-containing protein [Cellulomonas rhizosphaerae]